MEINENILLPYQLKVNALLSSTAIKVILIEKSRRIGLTWGLAAEMVLTAAKSKKDGGQNVYYMGYSREMGLELIDACLKWAQFYNEVVKELDPEDEIFDEEKDALKLGIRFKAGFSIIVLSSHPRSFRGRQGLVVIDEAAFHDDLEEVIKSALALTMWGGKVIIVSTHNGVENYFNELIADTLKGRTGYTHMRITLDDALKDGLYKRICKVTGKEWSIDAEEAWRDDLVKQYGAGAAEELFCEPRNSGGTYFPLSLYESCADKNIPVIRKVMNDDFVYEAQTYREAHIDDWLEDWVKPFLDWVNQSISYGIGIDIGRKSDLTVLWVEGLETNLNRKTALVVELANMPYSQQKQIFFYILDRIKLMGIGVDAIGIGANLAEDLADRYGHSLVEQVYLSDKYYNENFPPLKAAFEDGTITVPADEQIARDHRDVQIIKGVPKIDRNKRQKGDGFTRHGDAGVAHLFAYKQTKEYPIDISHKSTGQRKISVGGSVLNGSRGY